MVFRAIHDLSTRSLFTPVTADRQAYINLTPSQITASPDVPTDRSARES